MFSRVYSISPSNDSTVALEVVRRGLGKRKHVFFFERFAGVVHYAPELLDQAQFRLTVESGSVTCGDRSLKRKERDELTEYALTHALAADCHSTIEFCSTRIHRKRLRGIEVQGMLTVRGISRPVKVNAVLTRARGDAFQIDADASVRLSDFDVKPPTSMLGLARIEDDAELRLLLWAVPQQLTGQRNC